jgi:hypothetical protein
VPRSTVTGSPSTVSYAPSPYTLMLEAVRSFFTGWSRIASRRIAVPPVLADA